MRDERIERRLRAQGGVVAVWQLVGDGVSPGAIRHLASRSREVFRGVYVSGHGPLTQNQKLLAAALTAPHTWVDRWSAAHAYGFWSRGDGPVCVVRRGNGGPERIASPARRARMEEAPTLSVRRSARILTDDHGLWFGTPMLSPARTVLDLMGLLRSAAAQDRLVRDALRLQVVQPRDLHRVIAAHAGCRGTGALRGLVDQYAGLSLDRARSDAEAVAVEVLKQAGLPAPRLNVRICGQEADLSWAAQRFILELDSNEYHPFPEVDERKQALWEDAGWRVGRLGVHIPEAAPGQLIQVVRAGLSPGPM